MTQCSARDVTTQELAGPVVPHNNLGYLLHPINLFDIFSQSSGPSDTRDGTMGSESRADQRRAEVLPTNQNQVQPTNQKRL